MQRLIQHAVFAALLIGAITVPAEEATQTGEATQIIETNTGPIGGLSFVDEIELTVVNVLAYVTDERGIAVTDLKAEDFRITQDSQDKVISNFQLYTDEIIRNRREAAKIPGLAPTPSPGDFGDIEARPVYMILYVDNDNLLPMDRNRILRQLRPFIQENLFPPVQMMVVTHQQSIEVVVPFTSDRSDVLNGLRSIMRQTGARQTRESTRRDLLDKMRRYRQDSQNSQVNNYYTVLSQIIGFAEEEANSLAFTIGSLREIVTTMSGLPGKKSVLYLSNGLPMMTGLELIYAFASTYNDPSVMSQAASFDQSRRFESLVATANAQNVSFYTVGAGGLKNATMSTAEYAGPQDTISAGMGDSNFMDSLRFMAERTGGAAIINTNDITEGLVKVSQDFFTYYSLGYALNSSGADKVHDVVVTLPNYPDYTLRYRRRFVEKSIGTKVQDQVLTALLFPIDKNPMQLDFSAGAAAPASGDRWVLPIEVSFPLRKVALLPEGEDYVGRVMLFVAARDSGGEQSDIVRQEHEIRISADLYEESQRERFTITASMLMKSGNFTIVAGLLDPITRQSSYQTTKAVIRSGE